MVTETSPLGGIGIKIREEVGAAVIKAVAVLPPLKRDSSGMYHMVTQEGFYDGIKVKFHKMVACDILSLSNRKKAGDKVTFHDNMNAFMLLPRSWRKWTSLY